MRVGIAILFIAALGAGFYWLIKNNSTSSGNSEAENSEVRIASRHDQAVSELADALDDASENAQHAEKIAARLEQAISETRASSVEMRSLTTDNRAVPATIETVQVATDEGERAMRLMMLYSAQMSGRVAKAEMISDKAVVMADAIEKVEESQAQADQALEDAIVLSSDVDEEINDNEDDLYKN